MVTENGKIWTETWKFPPENLQKPKEKSPQLIFFISSYTFSDTNLQIWQ